MTRLAYPVRPSKATTDVVVAGRAWHHLHPDRPRGRRRFSGM